MNRKKTLLFIEIASAQNLEKIETEKVLLFILYEITKKSRSRPLGPGTGVSHSHGTLAFHFKRATL